MEQRKHVSELELLLQNYTKLIQLPWREGLSAAERVWFVVYAPHQERRLRLRLHEFRTASHNAGHGWLAIDLTNSFAEWMATHRYREAYFESPELLETSLQGYLQYLTEQIEQKVKDNGVDANTVVALTGLASLFGLTSVSNLVNLVRHHFPGRILVFFPGHKEASNYRFLDARDGWNYLSIAITPTDGSGV